MNKIKLAVLAILLAFGAAVAQDAEKKTELKVIVATEGEGDPREFHWVSDGEELSGLEVGDTRTLTGEDGRAVVVTRTADGMQFDIDGETVVVPDMPGNHMAFVGHGGEHDIDVTMLDDGGEKVDVRVMHGGPHMMGAHHPDGVTIISATELDDSVKDSIRSVLISAGVDEDVTFIDGSQRPVRVIKKRVEVPQ